MNQKLAVRPASSSAAVTNQSLDARRIAATPRGVAIGFPFYAQRAQNAELWDVEGRRFIDFGSGIAVLNTGHRHPRVMQAVREQIDHFTHTAYQVVPYESAVALAEGINALAPRVHAEKRAFFPTRAEPDDDAAKANRDKLIAFAEANPPSAVIDQMLPKLLGPQTLTSRHGVVEVVKLLQSEIDRTQALMGLPNLNVRSAV